MVAWHGTASPTVGSPEGWLRALLTGLCQLQRTHGPVSLLHPQGLLGETRASSRAQWPRGADCRPASKQCQGTLLLSGQSGVASEGPWTGRGLAGEVGRGQRVTL